MIAQISASAYNRRNICGCCRLKGTFTVFLFLRSISIITYKMVISLVACTEAVNQREYGLFYVHFSSTKRLVEV